MQKTRFIAWFMWFIAAVFYAYQYILRVMPNIMIDDFMLQFNIDAAVFGQFSGLYYIGYAAMHLPLGLMLDRHGPKKVMTTCILLTVAGVLPLIFAENWIYPVAGRFLQGIGSSAAILGTFQIVRMSFEEKYFTRMLSFAVTIGLIGAIYGGEPLRYMCSAWGYKTVVEFFAILGLFLASITYFITPDIKSNRKNTIYSDIKFVFTNKKVMLICCFAGFLVGPLEGFADVWGSAFLKHAYSLHESTAGYLPSMIFLGMCFGSPILSYIAERSGYYLGAIIVAGGCMFMTFVALISGSLTITTMTLGFLLVGLCSAYQILAIYKASTCVPNDMIGLTTSVANMVIMIFGYLIHSSIGFVVKTYSMSGHAIAYSYGVTVIPVGLFIGILGFMAIGLHERKSQKTAGASFNYDNLAAI